MRANRRAMTASLRRSAIEAHGISIGTTASRCTYSDAVQSEPQEPSRPSRPL